MSGNYTLKFSDPFKTDTVIVPTATGGSGKNDYNTSLELVGTGYPAYGQAFAQNFLKLLENFASPYPPENSIEGQLWYDTSDPTRKVLRVNNGSDTSSRWPSANGIYQQSNDPFLQYAETIAEGDIWVDTYNNQLKIRYGTEWTVVGPQLSSGIDRTGSESVLLQSNRNDENGNPISYPVIKNWVNGKVVEIISYHAFIPRVVIDGFSSINTGTNLTNKVSAKYNGVTEKSNSLVVGGNTVLVASEILRNRATISVHTGTFVVNDSSGLQIRNPNFPGQTIQLASGTDGNVLFNSTDATKSITIKITDSSFIKIDPNYQSIGINKAPSNSSPALDVNGGASFSGAITATSVTLSSGNLSVAGKSNLVGSVLISGLTTVSSRLVLGTPTGSGLILDPGKHDVYDIGSASKRFRHIHAAKFGNTITNSTVFYGNLIGTATNLASKRRFQIVGVVTTTDYVDFDGSANVTLTATITESLITSQNTLLSASSGGNILISDTGLFKISKQDFLQDVYAKTVVTGSISAYAGSSAPSGYLMCDGANHTSTWYTQLFGILGYTYGGSGANFKVPNMSTSTFVSTGTNTGTYVKYIIKT
jgi:hypothetical protein